MEKAHVAALRRAIKICGSQAALAEKLREFFGRDTISQQTISYWLTNEVLLDAEWWPGFEWATGNEVTRIHLRPDVFGREKAA